MAKNEITGRLVYIGQTEELPSRSGGNVFRKREFLLDATTYDLYTAERSQYENILALEMTGDRCADLDKFSVGTAVTVSFALQGREWTNRDGEVRRMTSVRCYGIEARQNRMQGANAVLTTGRVVRHYRHPYNPTIRRAGITRMNRTDFLFEYALQSRYRTRPRAFQVPVQCPL